MAAITGVGGGWLSVNTTNPSAETNLAVASGSHRYWRFVIKAVNGYTGDRYAGVSDLLLYDINDMANIATDYDDTIENGLTDIYSTNQTSTTYLAKYAFSGDVQYGESAGDFWRSDSFGAIGSYLQVEFVDAKDIQRYSIRNTGTGVSIDMAPTSFELQYSDNGLLFYTRHVGTATWPVAGSFQTADTFDQFGVDFNLLGGVLGSASLSSPTGTATFGATPADEIILAGATLLRMTGSADIGGHNASAELEELTGTASIIRGQLVRGDGDLAKLTGTAQLVAKRSMTGSGVLSRPTGSAVIQGPNAAQALEKLTGTADITRGTTIFSETQLQKLTGSASFGSGNEGTLESLTGTAILIGGGSLSIDARLQSLIGSGVINDHVATFEPMEGAATILSGNNATVYGYLSRLTGTGTISSASDAANLQASASLERMTGESLIITGNVFNGNASLKRLVAAADLYTANVITANATLALMTGAADMFSSGDGQVTITLPALIGHATINAGSSIDGISGNALAMNVSNRALTRFDAFGYNSFAAFNGVTLAANSNGVFALTGDTDNGAVINASIKLGKLDFDVQQLKTVDYAYVGYRADGDMQLTVIADDGTEYSYALAPRDTERHAARTRLGKGISGRYLQFGMSNVAGADFRIDTLELYERIRGRRIR